MSELTEQNRKEKFDDGTWRLCDVLTGDESPGFIGDTSERNNQTKVG